MNYASKMQRRENKIAEKNNFGELTMLWMNCGGEYKMKLTLINGGEKVLLVLSRT